MADQRPDSTVGPRPTSSGHTGPERPLSRNARRTDIWLLVSTIPIMTTAATWASGGDAYAVALVGTISTLLALATAHHAVTTHHRPPLEDDQRDGSIASPDLVTALVRTSDTSRHRAARALHAQAITAHVIVAALDHLTDDLAAGPARDLTTQIGRALGKQAESLRSLVTATAAGDAGNDLHEMLLTEARAHIASLRWPTRCPDLSIDVDNGLELDWPTETAVLGLVHRALDEIHRENGVRSVDVALTTDCGEVELRISYGAAVGHTAGTTPGPSRSSMATMHAFVSSLEGTIDATRTPDGHTIITATMPTHATRLASLDPRRDTGPRHLRAVPDPQ
jgi:signal transduction histidine kinase